MSNYSALKTAIQQAVYTNGNNEITGAGLQAVLLQIVNTVGDGYVFAGVATAGTSPGTPDDNVFYIAPAGTYTNFGSSYTVPTGSIGVFAYDGSWTKDALYCGYGMRTDINGQVGNTGLLSHVTGQGLYLVTLSSYTDVPNDVSNSSGVLEVMQYSTNYVTQRLSLFGNHANGGMYFRIVDVRDYSIYADWCNRSVMGGGLNINNTNSSSICSNDADNLPNNRIYGLALTSGHSVAHMPFGNGAMSGQIMTFGKLYDRSSSDSQLIVMNDWRMYKRVYWSGWGEWEAVGNTFYPTSMITAMLGGTTLASHLTRAGIYLLSLSEVAYSDLPVVPQSENYIMRVENYSTNYVRQTIEGMSYSAQYSRIVHKTNYTVFRAWQSLNPITHANITDANMAAICDSDWNNLPNNKVFGVSLSSGNTCANTIADGKLLQGMLVTYGKEYQRSTTDVQMFFENGTGLVGWRIYWGGWKPWKFFNQNSGGGALITDNILAVGDSIVRGYRNGGLGFLPYIGTSYKNDSVSGATVSNQYQEVTDIPSQLVAESAYNPAYIITDGGVNDYYRSLALGTIPTSPVTDDAGDAALNLATFCGGLQHLFYQMIKKFPNAKRCYVATHPMLDWDRTANSAGYTFMQLQDAVRAICKLYNVAYIDVHGDGIINTAFSQYKASTSWADAADKDAWNAENYVDSDGIHPADMGYRVGYAPIILSRMSEI